MLAAITHARFPAFEFEPAIVGPVILLEVLYLVVVHRLKSDERRTTVAQQVLWSCGVLSLLLAVGWPLDQLSDRYLFSAHMLQHTIISLVAPPLLLLGTPAWLARWVLSPRGLMTAARQVCRPFFALVIFNVFIIFTHWTTVMNATLRSESIHFVDHVGWLVTALIMWAPVLSPLPEIPRLGPPATMLYLFLQSVVPTVPASFLTFGDHLIYNAYAHVPRLWGISAIDDQRLAGLLMKTVGGMILWGFIAAAFFRWAYREQEADRRARRRGLTRMPSDDQILTWEQVEAEFERLGPAPKSEGTTPSEM